MRILMLTDPETVPADDPLLMSAEVLPESAMEYHIARGLRELGHEVEVLGFGNSIAANIEALTTHKPELVFNLTEWFKGNRRQDAHIAGLLDLLELPYTGSGPIGLMLCRDKAACKQILGHHRIRLPHFITLPPGTLRLKRRMVYPAIVKPLYEDGSDGISLASLVQDEAQLIERVRMIHEQRRQPAICEQFIEGREIYVGIVGNDRLRAFPPRELVFGKADEGGPGIATAKVKWDEDYRRKWSIDYVNAELDPALERRITRICKRVYRYMQIRDYGRIDLRITPAGDIYFLEANPNPNLAPDDDLAESAKKSGLTYPQLLQAILHQALGRHR